MQDAINLQVSVESPRIWVADTSSKHFCKLD